MLTAEHRRVLAGAAVLGLAPDWSLLHRVTGISEPDVLEALRAAEGSRLLTVDAGTLRWRHALTHDAVLGLVLPPERAMLSRRAAEVLLARGRPEDDAAAADLLLRAGADDTAADLLLTLARRDLAAEPSARPSGSSTTSQRTGVPPGRRGRAARPAALPAGPGTGGPRRAGPVLDEATGRSTSSSRWPSRGQPCWPAAGTRSASSSSGPAAPTTRAPPPSWPTRPTAPAGWTPHARTPPTAVARAEAAGDAEQLCDALVVLAKVQRLDRPAGGPGLFDRAAQVAAEHGLVDARVEAMLGQATLEMLETESPARLVAARRLAEQAGLLGQVTAIDLLRADAVLVHDGPAAAVPLAQELLERGRALEMPMPSIAGAFVLALAAAAAGDRRETERLLAPLRGVGGAHREAAMFPAAVHAMLALASHDLRTANAVLDPAVAALGRAPLHRSPAPVRPVGVAADGDRRPRRRGPAGARGGAGLAPPRQRGRSRVRRRGGRRTSEAVSTKPPRRSQEAEELGAATPWLRRVLRTVALDSAVVDGWGDPVPLLRASLAEHEQAGEDALARVVRDLLRRAGAPTRRGRGESSVPASLAALGVTSREADVLAMLVEGATNTEIAERLFLSRRTVETHVAHLLQKTSSATRAELRSRVAELDR